MFLPMLLMTGIVVGVFLGFLLLTLKRGNCTANRFLGIIMIVSSILVSDFTISKLSIYNSFPFLIGIAPCIIFLIGPLFYFYIKTLSGEDIILNKKFYLHFLPFVLLIIYKIPFFLSSSEHKLYLFENDSFFQIEHRVIILIQALHAITYILFLKIELTKNKKANTKNSVSAMINLIWARKCLNLVLFVFCFISVLYIINLIGVRNYHIKATIIPFFISLSILYIGFTGLKQPIIFPNETDKTKTKKYERSTLLNDKAEIYLQELISLMENDKLYLQNDLSLQKLAEKLNILPNHLSQVINEKTNQNFFDFINSYRIKHAQKLLSDTKSDLNSIIGIAYEVGFNSKSSFNSAFKKHSGQTPTEFKAIIKEKKTVISD